MKSVYQAIAKVTKQIGTVDKNGHNKFQDYDYATAADVLKKVQPLAMEAGLILIRSEVSKDIWKGPEGDVLAITYEYTVGSEETGETLPDKPKATGTALLFNKRGTPDDKAANKCGTAADKYFFISLFKIPTVDADDADACDGGGTKGQFENAPRQTATVTPLVTNTPRAGESAEQTAARQAQAERNALADTSKPHKLDTKDAVKWLAAMISAVDKAVSNAEIDAWIKLNNDYLNMLSSGNKKAYDRLRSITEGARKRLPNFAGGEVPADDGSIPADLDRRPADDEFIEGVDALFAAQASVDELDAVWADNEQEVLTKSRATRDRIAECYEQHVRRVKSAA